MKKLFIILFATISLATQAQDLKFLLKDGIIMQMRKYDSAAVATTINARVKYTDTSGILGPYQTAINTKQNTLVAGTDYLTPTGSAASLTSFPTFNQNTTGTAAGLSTGRTISISGDLAYTSPTFNGTSNVSAAGTLATVNSNVGSFGSATQVPSYTVNAKGLITAAANTTIQIPESQVTNLTTDLAAKQGTLTLTSTGTSGAATLIGNTLNIPSYSGGGGASDYLSVLSSSEIAITTTATLTIGRQHLISGTSVDYTSTLPPASGNVGKLVSIRIDKNATRLFTIKGNGAELIDGVNTRVMWKSEAAILYCDGVGWKKISGLTIPMVCQRSLSSISSTLFTTGAAVKVPLNRTDVDNSGFMADVANNRIKFVRPSNYDIKCVVVFNGFTATASRVITQLYVDALPMANSEVSAVIGSYTSPFLTTIINATTSNTISLYGYQNSGTTQGCWGQSPNITTMLVAVEIPSW